TVAEVSHCITSSIAYYTCFLYLRHCVFLFAKLSDILFPKLSIALFRCKTIASAKEPMYELLPPTNLVKAIVDAIPDFEREYLKLVVPIHVRPEATAGADNLQAIVDTISPSLPKRKEPADMQLPTTA